jgi:hypothetical protein
MEPPLIAPKVDERSKHDDKTGEVVDLALDVVDEVLDDDDPCSTCASCGDALDCAWVLDAGSCAVDGCGGVAHGTIELGASVVHGCGGLAHGGADACGSVVHGCGSLVEGLHCSSVLDGCGSLADGLHCLSAFDACHVADCDPGCW